MYEKGKNRVLGPKKTCFLAGYPPPLTGKIRQVVFESLPYILKRELFYFQAHPPECSFLHCFPNPFFSLQLPSCSCFAHPVLSFLQGKFNSLIRLTVLLLSEHFGKIIQTCTQFLFIDQNNHVPKGNKIVYSQKQFGIMVVGVLYCNRNRL